jgi:pyruvate/oxaloacetate carboxyltransferase
MHQDDINKDLGNYIHERKDRPVWSKMFGKAPTPKEEVKEEIKEDIMEKAAEADEKIAPEDKKDLEHMEGEIVEAHEEEEEIEERREGVLKRFFKKLNFSGNKPEEDEQEEVPEQGTEDEEEMKDFLKNMHTWITQLPPETLKEFKESKDFELYTKVLKKYNLIK